MLLFERFHANEKQFYTKEMEERGFNFHYLTSYSEIKPGQICKFCYDIGYLPIGQQQFKIKLKNSKTKQ